MISKTLSCSIHLKSDVSKDNFKSSPSIVENAVKHGITKKRGGGTVRIVTREEKLHYRISVTDTGIGFDQTKKSEDGRNHVGIQNVRARLESMVNGKLLIESVPGKGTVVTVLIPKKGEEKNDHSGSR